MTDPGTIWVAGFCTGAAFIGALAGWFGPTERTNNGLWNKQQRRARARDNNHDWRRSFNHENTNAPQGPPPLKFRRSEPDLPERFIRMDEGPIARSTTDPGPTTPKPAIIPKGQWPGGRIR